MYYVYLIRNEAGTIYTGFTANLKNRLKAHNLGMNTSTRGHQWEVKYYEAYKSEEDARKRERALKQGKARRWLRTRIQGSIPPDK
jgi:putative endonuclease